MTIDNIIGIVGDALTLVMALATVGLASATYRLARDTKALASDAEKERQQADRHHRENLRPFCVIEFDGAEHRPFGANFDARDRRQNATAMGLDVSNNNLLIQGELKNRGLGPATDIVVYLNARLSEQDVFWMTKPVVAAGIVGPAEAINIRIEIKQHNIMTIWKNEEWMLVQPLEAVAGDTYEVVIRYKDVFGNYFRTVHARGIWSNNLVDITSAAVREKMVISQDRPTPVFLTGEQPLRTYGDLPPTQNNVRPEDIADAFE